MNIIDPFEAQAELREQCDALRFQLVSTELDLAITFCVVAATTNDQARSDRNIANAKQAYESAAYYLHVDLNSAANPEIRKKLTQLESLLKDLVAVPPLLNTMPLA